MNILIKSILLTLTFVLYTVTSFAQEKLSSKEEKKILENAELYFEEGDLQNIPKAMELFEKLEANKPEDPYYKLMVGICYTQVNDKKEIAIQKLTEVKKMNPEFNLVNNYLGRAYAANHQFDTAIEFFNQFLKADDIDDETRLLTKQRIIYCQNAKQYIQDSIKVEINDIGNPINTSHSEYVPVITPDESMLIYTYRGERSKGGLRDATGKPDPFGQYYEDIMISYKLGENWLSPESIGENINTDGHDASVGLSVDGQKLFIYKQTKKDNGDIYESTLEGETWSRPKKLEGDVNTEAWEGSATLTSDGQTLYFSSNREGGMGGRDLYSAELMPDGKWGNVKNLGPQINTQFDEDAPFIHPDAKTLYFSSKGPLSMGGYDIFYSYLTDKGWETPTNVGYPVNTIDDDRFYVLSADAKTGYYSSSGRTKNGDHNIYTVSPGHFGKRPILALVVGVTKADGQPVDADITVTNDKTGELEGKFKSNSTSGKYMLALTPGNKYKIAIEVEGYETKIDYLDIENLETYVQVEHDFNLFSKKEIDGVAVADEENELQGKIDTQIEKYKYENTKDGYIKTAFNKVLNTKGTEPVENVQYYIQPNDMEKIKNVSGVAARSMVKDGTDEVVIGPFSTLLEAELFRTRLAKEDTSITAMNIKVDDDGVEKSLYQFYPEEFNRKDFNQEISLHEKITQKDKVEDEIAQAEKEKKAKELTQDDEVDLTNENLVDAKEKTIAGLSFKVEIAAVQDEKDFTLGHLEKYGKITAKKYPDGTIRYTFGPFETLAETEAFRQMLIEKEKETEDAFITVFVFGQRKTLEEYQSTTPCGDAQEFIDFSEFIGKDLNDKSVYDKLIQMAANICVDGLEFKVQIAAYRFPKNYQWDHLKQFGKPVITDYPDGITRFTQGNFNKIKEAEELRQKIITAGQKDAWITPFFNGQRMLLEDLIKENFYGKKIN